jgi:hypothetical protein
MNFREAMLSLQLAADERAGFTLRERQRMARSIEDQAVADLSRTR